MSFHFGKKERLRSEKLIGRLFEKGNPSFVSGPFRMSFIPVQPPQPAFCQVLIAVSKKNFKTAVSRNRIRRQLREMYRLHKADLMGKLEGKNLFLAVLIAYTARKELIYKEVEPAFIQGLKRISHELEKTAAVAIPAADQDI